jgi:excinuclease UvrABC ATPase subunit
MFEKIEVRGARENNLKDISLDIPKRKITVFTGVSGSGKSSLVFGTIAAESQRLLNETFSTFVQNFLPRQAQPEVDSLSNLSVAILVDQARLGGNSRSTVGTYTDAYSMLRVIYSRLGKPAVPSANLFSFNDPKGMCAACEGLGFASTINVDALVDKTKSLKEGAIQFPTFAVDSWYWNIFAFSGFFDVDKKIKDYSQEELTKLLSSEEVKIKTKVAGTNMNITYEGLLLKFKRLYLSKDAGQMQNHIRVAFEQVVTRGVCDSCKGARLNQTSLQAKIKDKNIADCASMQVSDLSAFIKGLNEPSVAPLLTALAARLDSLTAVGLGYLSLERESATLSGGESQRVRMVKHLGSSLTDITYVFDEPSIGLHPNDIYRLNELLRKLRDKGNTVLVVEHKPEVIAIADHVVDLGPLAGKDGGKIVYQGDLAGLYKADTLTGRLLSRKPTININPRGASGKLSIKNASLHNVRDVSVDIPRGVLTVITGVAGSGKSSLIRGCLPKAYPETLLIDQTLRRGSSRSNTATYTGLLDSIRKLFATTNKTNASLFSANSKGACPDCEGLGVIYTDLAHLEPMATMCETCEGRCFTDEVLKHQLRGKNISEVMRLSVREAKEFFTEKALRATLCDLDDVGLGYLTLGQPLSTLSGGERQRLKLASELGSKAQTYVLDEPTTGLHLNDIDNLLRLLHRLVENKSTVIVIEHHLEVIARADWIIDMGPGAGHDGGRVIFEGTPAQLIKAEHSLTGKHLQKKIAGEGHQQ